MNFYRLTSARDALFDEAFALYGASFPPHEQRPRGKQAAVLSNPLYHFDVIMTDGISTGILLYWEGSGYTYIEHFAIHPSLRGKSAGSKSLELFCEKHSFVILEIDPPVSPAAVRRAGFYKRLGFQTNDLRHVHPAYQKQFPPHELTVLSYPGLIAEGGYQLFRRELREVFMEDILL